MNAAEVRASLHGRWPDERYLHIEEAPLNSYRQGNKIDVLVIDQWQSGQHATEAIEVKVSYSDWTKEWRRTEWWIKDHEGKNHAHRRKPNERVLDYYRPLGRRYYAGLSEPPEGFEPTVERIEIIDTSKNVSWRLKATRFWVAAPAELAVKVAADCERLEELHDWGVLACHESRTEVLRKPKTTTPSAWSPQMWLGIVRSAADCGPNALQRAYDRGFRDGRQRLAS